MLVTLAFSLMLGAGSPTGCLPDESTLVQYDNIRQQVTVCQSRPDQRDCLDSVRQRLDGLLQAQPGSLQLQRLRQDLAPGADSEARTRDSAALIERYQTDSRLSDALRHYLTARLQRDDDALQQSSNNGIAWAQLDRIVRTDRRDPLLTGRSAAAALRDFWERCPDADEWLFTRTGYFPANLAPEVLAEARRSLLARPDPPWEMLMGRPLILGLQLSEGSADPVAALAAELELVDPEARQSAGFWLYQSTLYQLGQDPDAAREANQRALAIDPCVRRSPLNDPEAASLAEPDSPNACAFFARIDREIVNCQPSFDRYRAWLMRNEYCSEVASAEALARIRDRTPFESKNQEEALAWSLAHRDIRESYQPEAAWATLEEQIATARERVLSDQPTQARVHWLMNYWTKLGGASRLAWQQDDPDRAQRWLKRLETETDKHRDRVANTEPMQAILAHVEATITELHYFAARNRGAIRTAIEHALNARQQGLNWVDLDSLRSEWIAAGQSSPAFDALLDEYGLSGVRRHGWQPVDTSVDEFMIADLDGRQWRLEELSGQRIVLNIWATWCRPCMDELPLIQEVWEHYGKQDGVQVLTVNIDHKPGLAQHLIDREDFDFPVLMAGPSHELFGGMTLPRTWLLDSESRLRWAHTGFSPATVDGWVNQLIELIDSLD